MFYPVFQKLLHKKYLLVSFLFLLPSKQKNGEMQEMLKNKQTCKKAVLTLTANKFVHIALAMNFTAVEEI